MIREVYRRVGRVAAIGGLFASTALLSGCGNVIANAKDPHEGCYKDPANPSTEVCPDSGPGASSLSYFPQGLKNARNGLIEIEFEDLLASVPPVNQGAYEFQIDRAPHLYLRVRIKTNISRNLLVNDINIGTTSEPRQLNVPHVVNNITPGKHTIRLGWKDWRISESPRWDHRTPSFLTISSIPPTRVAR